MKFIKYIMLFLVFIATNLIGKTISQKYKYRLEELEEFRNTLNMFKTKIKFTYAPIGEIFEDISIQTNKANISKIYREAKENMSTNTAGKAWNRAIDTSSTNMKKEDMEVLKNLSKLLRNVRFRRAN